MNHPGPAGDVAEAAKMPERAQLPSRTSRILLRTLVWLPVVLVVLPVLVVVIRAMEPAGEMWGQVVEFRLPGYLRHTALLAVLVTLVAVLFGVPSAWIVSVYQFPGRGLLEWMLLLPLAMPGFIAAVAYIDTFRELVPVYIWIRREYGVDAFLRSQEVAPWIFAVLVLASTLFPYVFLSCRAVFSRQAAGALEAARLLGAGGFRVFLRIAMPMARPAVVAGGSLVAMEAVNDYGLVTYFGLTPLTPGIFRAWTEGHPGVAMRLAVLLAAFVMLALWMEYWQRGRRRFTSESEETALSRKRLGLGGTTLAWLCCGIPLAIGFFVPAWRMARWTWQSWPKTEWAGHWEAAGNSFVLAAGAAVLVAAGALVLAGGQRAFPGAGTRWAMRLAVLGYAFPGALVAVGVGALVSGVAASVPGGQVLALSASAFGLITAYFTRYLAVGVQPLVAGFERLSPGLHEAARSLGAGPVRALARVDLPLVWPSLVAGATLAFVDVFKELPLTLVLRPFDFETLATRAFRLADEGRIPEASAPGLAMVALSLLGLIPLNRMLRRYSA